MSTLPAEERRRLSTLETEEICSAKRFGQIFSHDPAMRANLRASRECNYLIA
jgi:hypothetical protein